MHLNEEIKKLIAIEAFDENSLFAVSAIDLESREVVYANQAMQNIMADISAQKCWAAIYGQESPCSWCKTDQLCSSKKDANYIVYENFNEFANRWYQIQDKVITLEDGKKILISFALDISMQKDAQSKLIDAHVKLSQQREALHDAKEKLKEQANRDPLTNLYNRRYFNDTAQRMVAMAKRAKKPLSIIMIDIDKFKNINDTYGHHIGDEVIRVLADKLEHTIRESDFAFRFGGEEFALVLPSTDIYSAEKVAQKIRLDIEGLSLKIQNGNISFTISIGVDELDHVKENNLVDVLKRADHALYEAKTTGRNRVCLYNGNV